ncbi:MAG TPA: 1,4-alpha-glucan branching protein domain-containing protein [Syntrophorhabdaceae bacterium]|nr:1,4-alpha-glucan branching protein domain-containing protein [Syntrophorhabdaceae bacterium]
MPGVFALMLHSHIPYCRKSGVWPAGEEWLFEAMNETYIPLLRALKALYLDGIKPRIMVGFVPVLMEQLADVYMKERFRAYMEDKIERARRDAERFREDKTRQAISHYWFDLYERNYHAYRVDFHEDILGTFRWLQDEGAVEVLTSAATHGFLPLLEHDSAVFAQVRVGVETYKTYFGRSPRGFWLPECAYRPAEWSQKEGRMRRALDEWLADHGIEYFFVEGVGITGASFVQRRHDDTGPTTYQGYGLASGCAVFGRNEATGRQVWSPDEGYPGDWNYLEFHRKDHESGLRYWRVTGQTDKEYYDPEAASRSTKNHAHHFVSLVLSLLGEATTCKTEPIVVCPYDCELFGHWWHEGVSWLETIYRLLADTPDVVSQSLGDYIDRHRQEFSTIAMQPSSWGLNADFTVWKNPEHGWIWPYINASVLEAEQVFAGTKPTDQRGERIFKQMARELLLMQGSDWPFLLFTAQAREYANQRFHHHHQRFRKLIWAAGKLSDAGRLSEAELAEIEDIDYCWPALDYSLFTRRDDGKPSSSE